MKFLNTFIYSLRHSLLDPSYYLDVLKSPLSFSFKFFFAFCLIFGLISATAINITVIPEINKFAKKSANQLLNLYPNDLEITIKDKKASINQEEPYFIPIDLKNWIDQDIPDSAISNLLVIDTRSSNPTKDINQYHTLALLTKDALVIKGERNEMRVLPLEQMEVDNLSINHSMYQDLITKIAPYLKYLSTIMAILVAIFFLIFFPLSKLLHLLVFSLITMAISSVMKPKLTYRQTFQIGLHAFVLPTLLNQVIRLFTPQLPIPFFYSLVFLIYFLLILSKLEKKKLPKN